MSDPTRRPPLSFVVPAYGSEATLAGVLDEIGAEFPEAEAVVVVDGSPDRVAEVAREYARGHPERRVLVIELRQNRGQHFATLQGFRAATGELVATVDDDGQNPIADYHALVEALRAEDLDCVYGAFDETRQSAFRRLLSRGNKWLSVHFMGNKGRVPVGNVRVMRADLAHTLEDARTPYPFIDALVLRATKHLGWRRVSHRPRAGGRSGYNLWRLVNLAVSHTTIFSTLPLLAIALVAFGAALVNLVWAAVVFVRAMTVEGAPLGWPTLMVALTVMFAILFLFLGVLGIYVGRLYIGFNSSSLGYQRELARPEGRAAAEAEARLEPRARRAGGGAA